LKILHVTTHLGGGLGKVVVALARELDSYNTILTLTQTEKHIDIPSSVGYHMNCILPYSLDDTIKSNDIIIIHYYNHRLINELLSRPLPPCRLVFWHHRNEPTPESVINFPDRFINVSPVQGQGEYIWSTRGVDEFLKIKPEPHTGFNIGYVGTVDWKKIHPEFLEMCYGVDIPDAHFIVVGENNLGVTSDDRITFVGHVDDIRPYLARMDMFGYPLRQDHYGTAEQVLGEAMAAGVVPVVLDNPSERLIAWGNGGYVCDNENEYMGTLSRLREYPHQRALNADCCRIYARKLYSLDTMISRWDKVFEEMMSEPKRGRKPL
jgi:glycosyltransferase involved in cell wall biosynthesis